MITSSNSHQSLVSVIIPNYNHARYLKKRIDSVLEQTFQDFELLILDDCSQDESREIIQTYAHKDSRIKVHFNEANSGSTFKQWNKGVSLARGKYIWIAESDDYADKQFLENLLPCLENHPKVGVVYCQSWIVDESDTIIGNMLSWTHELDADRWKSDYLNNGLDECKRYLFHKPTIPNASAVLFRRDTYVKIGMAEEQFVMCGDWLHWIRMLLYTDVCFIAKPLNYFRQHSGTTRHILTHNKVLVRIKEEYQILSYILNHVNLSVGLRNKLYKDYFKRTIDFCPISLKFSAKFLEFINIVKEVDPKAYRRILWYILKRSFTYLPEKLGKKLTN